MGANADAVQWIVVDVAQRERSQAFDIWHDRVAYVERMRRAVKPGEHITIGTFAFDGPKCSGFPILVA